MGAVYDADPICGRIAMFYADTIAHEVMPTVASRFAVTIWYYDDLERAQALEEAKTTRRDA